MPSQYLQYHTRGRQPTAEMLQDLIMALTYRLSVCVRRKMVEVNNREIVHGPFSWKTFWHVTDINNKTKDGWIAFSCFRFTVHSGLHYFYKSKQNCIYLPGWDKKKVLKPEQMRNEIIEETETWRLRGRRRRTWGAEIRSEGGGCVWHLKKKKEDGEGTKERDEERFPVSLWIYWFVCIKVSQLLAFIPLLSLWKLKHLHSRLHLSKSTKSFELNWIELNNHTLEEESVKWTMCAHVPRCGVTTML